MARISRAICQPGGQGLGRDLASPAEITLNPVYMDIELRASPKPRRAMIQRRAAPTSASCA
eukprot:15445570-Alexandrium_andersonii.AAC.1